MKIDARRVDAFLRRPDPAVRTILVYGPDGGLVRERAEMLARTVVPDLADPFRIAAFTGRALITDPARLADEAAALVFGGGRRVLRVRDAGDDVAALLATFLEDARGDPLESALTIVEAGDLGPRSRLRTLFESNAAAAAIPCYADDADGVAALIQSRLRRDGIAIAPDALDYLVAHLGNDRMVTRGEIEKLALYAGRDGRLELPDVVGCVGDSGALSLDEIAMAVSDGDLPGLLRALDRAFADGNAPVSVLRAVARHFQRLHLAAGLVAGGQKPEQAIAALRPPVFFKARGPFLAQLRRWPPAWLGSALSRLTEAEIACKTTGMPDETLCVRTLMEIARAARRKATA
jgi:DNA polymerase III subunit delta